MSKELFISASPHETKVAVWEDEQLVEVCFERKDDVGLVGGIYKGRVSRVLPGMQSAFVNIGLERDAFLYVSDFFEDAEEYDKLVTEAEARVTRYAEPPAPSTPVAPETPNEAPVSESRAEAVSPTSVTPPLAVETGEAGAIQPGQAQVPLVTDATVMPRPPAGTSPLSARPAEEASDYRQQGLRGRRRRRRGRGFGEPKFHPKSEFRGGPTERQGQAESHPFEILPGESLAKYRHATPEAPAASAPSVGFSGLDAASGTEGASAPPEDVQVGLPQVETLVDTTSQHPDLTSSPAPSEPALGGESPATGPSVAQTELKPDINPQPLWQRLVSTVFGESSASPDRKAELAVEQSQASEPPTPAATTPLDEPPPTTQVQAESPGDSSGLGSAQLEAARAPATEPVVPGEAAQGVPAPVQNPSPGLPAEPDERKYTLREQHQRPHFAPRRGRRGRRGRGQPSFRPEIAQSSRQEGPRSANIQPLQISDLLKEGQEILVQIAKEPLGRKGARITSHIALPGRYLVYMPTVDHIGVSRKIASEEERLRLRNIILENKGSLTGGFIVRTAAQGRSEEEFKADLKFLSTLWNETRTKAEQTKAPALLYRDLDLVQRILRDILSPDFKLVWVDSEIEYERVLDFVNRCQPSLVGNVKLYTRDGPLFEEFGIQAEIDNALKSKVWLKSGGYIVVNQTEALVAIDVNTGKYVGKTNRLEDTIVKTNIDAVQEIVRQIRLRDLGGIIVIDFIDMDERRNRNKVVQALDEALRHDRAPTKILTFNDFGLVALTRKRVKQSLERTLCEPCNYCTGTGWIKSVITICYEILAEARKMASNIEGNVLTLRVNPEVAHALKSREGVLISELESLTHKDVIIKADPTAHQERFEIF